MEIRIIGCPSAHIKINQGPQDADKGLYSQNYGFSIVMHRCESWTIKKAEHRRIDAFEPWCWRRLLSLLLDLTLESSLGLDS